MKAASGHTPLFTVAEVETSTANGLQTKVYMHSLHTDQRLCKKVEIKLCCVLHEAAVPPVSPLV